MVIEAGCGAIRLAQSVVGRRAGDDGCIPGSAASVCEAIAIIRTTASLGLENHVLQSYSAALAKQRGRNVLPVIKSSILMLCRNHSCFFAESRLG